MDHIPVTREFLLEQCRQWPALEPQDLLKALHQSTFGCGHFVTDKIQGMALLTREWDRLADCPQTTWEALDGDYVRVYLSWTKKLGMAPETVFRLFQLSAQEPRGTMKQLHQKLDVLLNLAKEGKLPVSHAQALQAAEDWKGRGCPACHHSDAFRQAYQPAYRVIHKKFLWFLPLLGAIDQKCRIQSRVCVALEGGSAAGKTTLAALLAQIYGCTILHMDDFFLQPHQRRPERFAQPGGNVDWERFQKEVLIPLSQGQTIQYRPFDCQTQTIRDAAAIEPSGLTIVEGAYSMHPELAPFYDLSAFLQLSAEMQRLRIQNRNTPDMQQRFFDTWIPLEKRYFEATDTLRRCSMILSAEPGKERP